MIVKIAEAPKNKRDVANLVKYITDAVGGRDPSTWERSTDYILDKKNDGHRTGDIRVTNCFSDDPADATLEILATQAKNTRSKKEKELHIIVSFPHGEQEKLTKDTINDIEDELIKSIGLTDHQRISAQHLDKDHFHIHILVNKVNPKTFNNVTPYYPKNKLMQMAEKLELKHGLKITNHNAFNRYSNASNIEAHRGEKSFATWVKENIADTLVSLVSQDNTTWDDLHSLLAKYDLEIRPRGAGLVINARGEKKLSIKASDVNRLLSNKNLKDKLGDYQENTKPLPDVEAFYKTETIYQKSSDLFSKYQEQKNNNLSARREEQQKLYETSQQYIKNISEWYEVQRLTIKKSNMSPGEKREAYKNITLLKKKDITEHKAKRFKEKEAINAHYPNITWNDYLKNLSQNGNTEALSILRSKTTKEETLSKAILSASSLEEIKDIILTNLKPVVSKNGNVSYYVKDGGHILDMQRSIVVDKPTPGATALALSIAVEKYPNNKLKVSGSEEFKEQVVLLAIKENLKISFSDPVLENKKQELLNERTVEMNNAIIDNFIKNTKDDNILRYNILYQKQWTEADSKYTKNIEFIEVKELDNHIKVALFKSNNVVFVKPLTAKEFIKASGLKQGQKVSINKDGLSIGGNRTR